MYALLQLLHRFQRGKAHRIAPAVFQNLLLVLLRVFGGPGGRQAERRIQHTEPVTARVLPQLHPQGVVPAGGQSKILVGGGGEIHVSHIDPHRLIAALFAHHPLGRPPEIRKMRPGGLQGGLLVRQIREQGPGGFQHRVPHHELEGLIRLAVGVGLHMQPQGVLPQRGAACREGPQPAAHPDCKHQRAGQSRVGKQAFSPFFFKYRFPCKHKTHVLSLATSANRMGVRLLFYSAEVSFCSGFLEGLPRKGAGRRPGTTRAPQRSGRAR